MIGAQLTSANGFGVTYRYVKNKSGLSISFSPIIYTTSDKMYNTNEIHVGLNYNYYIRKSNVLDFSIFVGGAYKSSTDEYSFTDRKFVNSNTFKFGFGPQIDFRPTKELNIEVSLGYGLYNIPDDISSSLAAGIGMFYNIYK